MRTRLDTDLETIQREAQLRRIGRDLHDQAAAISSETVDAVAAVVTKLASSTEYGEVVEEGFGEAKKAEVAVRHLRRRHSIRETPRNPLGFVVDCGSVTRRYFEYGCA